MTGLKKFNIGYVNLNVRKEALEHYLNKIYERFYKKERFKHISRNDKRLPHIKITDDIFSSQIWFKDKSKNEHRIFLDGTIKLNDININTISVDGELFNKTEYHTHIEMLNALTSICDGYILISTNETPSRLKNGYIDNQKTLLKELYNVSPDYARQETKDLYDWMSELT